MQQTVMCMWFPVSQLPFAYGLMLFLVKVVRTTNDNFASVFYNEFGLTAYFWLGFTICLFSLFCTYLLVQIHESVMVPQTQQNKTCSKTDFLSVRQLVSNMPQEFWLFCAVDAMGYSAVHAFYPNMPKFF